MNQQTKLSLYIKHTKMIFSTSLGESKLHVLFFYFHTGACFDKTIKLEIFKNRFIENGRLARSFFYGNVLLIDGSISQ